MIFEETLTKAKKVCHDLIKQCNANFNKLSKQRKQAVVIVFGVCVTAISVMIILNSNERKAEVGFRPERIAMPYDIFMEDESSIGEDQLTPVGKMKGEIDGEFESFYVAVDNQGAVYINRDIEYSERAYDKTDDWKQISRERLKEYEKDLHFIPSQSRGIRR